MHTLYVIGIGSGHPSSLTDQAKSAFFAVDHFFVIEKEGTQGDIKAMRHALIEKYGKPGACLTNLLDQKREPVTTQSEKQDAYDNSVKTWTDNRSFLLQNAISEAQPDTSFGMLAWGDPGFYDSVLRVIEGMTEATKITIEVKVVPGISSLQLLAASHAISLTEVGKPLIVTTGRKLELGFPKDVDNVVVMLDGTCVFRSLSIDCIIYWGAYLGSAQEEIISGDLKVVATSIVTKRAELRKVHGWIMDIYLLRRHSINEASPA